MNYSNLARVEHGAVWIPAIHQERFYRQAIATIGNKKQAKARDDYKTDMATQGRTVANTNLAKKAEKAEQENYHELNKEAQQDMARGAAIRCHAAEVRGDVWEVIAEGVKIAKDFGIHTAHLYKHGEQGVAARFQSFDWWLANISKTERRQSEAAAIRGGIVHKGAQIYATDEAVERRRECEKLAREFMERVTLESEDGDTISMATAAAAGVSNPAIRHAELMTRINGFEEVAKTRGHVGIFCTATTPSRMHGHSTTGSKHDKTTPLQAQKYLSKVWARVRAALATAGVMQYGFRVAEPHHDGTPHWHMIVFMRKSDAPKFRKIFAAKFRAEDSHELTTYKAKKARVDFKTIDPTKGSAAAYMAKYIAKNISGEGVGKDYEGGGDCAQTSERVLTWAGLWGIRQFQQIGGHYVTTWREARRVREIDKDALPPSMVQAWQAAQRQGDKFADWAAFIEALGGVETRARDALIMVAAIHEEADGIYGKTKRRKVVGLWHSGGVLETLRKVWTVKGNRTKH